jgi:hypothetical protein
MHHTEVDDSPEIRPIHKALEAVGKNMTMPAITPEPQGLATLTVDG